MLTPQGLQGQIRGNSKDQFSQFSQIDINMLIKKRIVTIHVILNATKSFTRP